MTAAAISDGFVPLLDPRWADLLENRAADLHEWVLRHGSPLHLVAPEALARNAAELRAAAETADIHADLFYGAKVNQSPALIAAAVGAGIGVDVSSSEELRHACHAGAVGERIIATGPAKTKAFHAALIGCDAAISLDSPEELTDLIDQLPAGAMPCRVLPRLCPSGTKGSRFGMPPADMRDMLVRIAAEPRLNLAGFHMHLPGYAVKTRVAAIEEARELISSARALGMAPRMLDIGGGLPVRYVSEAAYDVALAALSPKNFRTGRVPDNFYPYGGPMGAADWLTALLSTRLSCGASVAEWLKTERLRLGLEPGRALVDQAAISLFRVARIKQTGPGTAVIFVEGSSFSACETWFGSEFLSDPLLIPRSSDLSSTSPVRAYIAGHSCLDEDVLTNRLLQFPRSPMAGDLLCFANTGGYQMDLLENRFHRHPLPARMIVRTGKDGVPTLQPDTLEEVTKWYA